MYWRRFLVAYRLCFKPHSHKFATFIQLDDGLLPKNWREVIQDHPAAPAAARLDDADQMVV